MKAAKAVQAIQQRVKVSHDRRIEITSGAVLHPGSEVEVIIVATTPEPTATQETNIYEYAEKLKQRKAIPRYSLRDLERIIHQSRGVNG